MNIYASSIDSRICFELGVGAGGGEKAGESLATHYEHLAARGCISFSQSMKLEVYMYMLEGDIVL